MLLVNWADTHTHAHIYMLTKSHRTAHKVHSRGMQTHAVASRRLPSRTSCSARGHQTIAALPMNRMAVFASHWISAMLAGTERSYTYHTWKHTRCVHSAIQTLHWIMYNCKSVNKQLKGQGSHGEPDNHTYHTAEVKWPGRMMVDGASGLLIGRHHTERHLGNTDKFIVSDLNWLIQSPFSKKLVSQRKAG